MPVLGGMLAGTAVQLQQPALLQQGVAAGLLVLALAGAWWLAREQGGAQLRRGSVLAFATCLAGLAAFAACHWRGAAYAADALDPGLEARDLRVTGVVAAMPQHGEFGPRFRFRVEQAWDGHAAVRLPPQVLLSWPGGVRAGTDAFELQAAAPALRAGDRWQLQVRLRAPHGNLNPHGFDYELWLWEQGLQATGYVRAGPRDLPPQWLEASAAHPIERARQAVREALLARVRDPAAAGVLAALVVGDQSAIERAEWELFRATGIAHLVSISGLHVTMFAWLAAALVRAAWRRSAMCCLLWPAQHAALAGGVLLATGYALFSGWGVPAQRTLLMLGVVAWLRWSGRRWPWPVTWLASAAVVVAADPWSMLQPGFWLSFVAVGVLFAAGGREDAARGWRGAVTGLLREQAVVTVALAPLGLLLFGQVSMAGLAANLVAIPWVTLLLTPLALAGSLLPAAWDPAAWAVQVLLAVLQPMAQWPWAVWMAPAPPPWAAAAGVAGGVLLVMSWPLPVRALGLALLIPVLLWQPGRPAAGTFEVLAADVGQGMAVVVRTAGHTLVYDTGPRFSADSDAGQRVLVPLLRALGERVDRLVLSHRDADHTGGAVSVLAAHPGAEVIASVEAGHASLAGRPFLACRAGQQWEWDGVRFTVLHPASDDAPVRPNAASCVLRVEAQGRAVLLPGDIEAAQEAALLGRGLPLAADLLLVPHHGSRTSSTPAFIASVAPRWAIVQAGYRNRFGHPAPAIVERYRTAGVHVLDTAACGAAWWSSARPHQIRCERLASPRYWRHRLPLDLP